MSRLAPSLLVCLALVGCPSDPATDAGADAGGDTGPATTIAWTESSRLPVPLAHAAGVILTSGLRRWLFVVGGAAYSGGAIGAASSAAYRAEINLDGTLGPWEMAGTLAIPPELTISQHGVLRLTGEDLRQGIAIAGGRTGGGGEIPFVLATYVDDAGALDSPLGAFAPMIAAGEGQWQMTFMPFDPHALALVGGLDDAGFTDRVQIAQINIGTEVPNFVPGPSLPAPRAAHAWVRRERTGLNPDLYVVGGHNDDGSTDDVLRTTRDGSDQVNGWEVVGTMTSAPYGHASVVVDDQLYVVGGFVDTTLTDRVRRAAFDATGHLERFEVVTDATLPYPLAHAAAVQDDVNLYLIGGIDAGAASDRVLIGRF